MLLPVTLHHRRAEIGVSLSLMTDYQYCGSIEPKTVVSMLMQVQILGKCGGVERGEFDSCTSAGTVGRIAVCVFLTPDIIAAFIA